MRKLLILCLLISGIAHSAGIISTKRISHVSSNLGITNWTQVFGTIARPAQFLTVNNSFLSGTLQLSIGCGTTQTSVMYVPATYSPSVVPLSMGQGECLWVRAAVGTVTTGDSTYSLFGAE